MRNYIAQLYKHLEHEEAKREAARQKTAPVTPINKPLETQLIELFRSLPEAELRRPWLMQELTVQLQGRYRAAPSPQKVSEALRKLGWRRARMYGRWGGRRYWLPPGSSHGQNNQIIKSATKLIKNIE